MFCFYEDLDVLHVKITQKARWSHHKFYDVTPNCNPQSPKCSFCKSHISSLKPVTSSVSVADYSLDHKYADMWEKMSWPHYDVSNMSKRAPSYFAYLPILYNKNLLEPYSLYFLLPNSKNLVIVTCLILK